jgi:hypothetical protein
MTQMSGIRHLSDQELCTTLNELEGVVCCPDSAAHDTLHVEYVRQKVSCHGSRDTFDLMELIYHIDNAVILWSAVH